MKSFNYLLVLLMGVAFAFISCEEALITPQPSSSDAAEVQSDPSVKENNGAEAFARVNTATYQFKVGAPFFGPPDFPPFAVAIASNGDMIEVAGEGTLSIHPKAATGYGTFVHKDADGNAVGNGTWTATELLSFKEYGPSTDPSFPPSFRAGYANIRVHLAGGGAEFHGILRVYCLLPGVMAPASTPEGIHILIQGGLNFNKIEGGAFGGPTLFILQ